MRSSRGLAMWSSMCLCRYSNSAIMPVGPLLERQGDALEDVVHEPAEDVGVLLGQAEHVGDDPDGDVLRVLLGGVDDVAALACASISSSQ